jgi:hypothetical protein
LLHPLLQPPRIILQPLRRSLLSRFRGISMSRAWFLSSHETLLLLSYPHLHQTHLCKKVLRRVLRASVLDHSSVFPLLLSWSEHANQANHDWMRLNHPDEQVRTKLSSMQHVTLEDIGLTWPAARNRFGEDEEEEDVESATESEEDDELRFCPSLSPLSGDTGDDGSSGNRSSAVIHSDDEQAARRRREVSSAKHWTTSTGLHPATKPFSRLSMDRGAEKAEALSCTAAHPARQRIPQLLATKAPASSAR